MIKSLERADNLGWEGGNFCINNNSRPACEGVGTGLAPSPPAGSQGSRAFVWEGVSSRAVMAGALESEGWGSNLGFAIYRPCGLGTLIQTVGTVGRPPSTVVVRTEGSDTPEALSIMQSRVRRWTDGSSYCYLLLVSFISDHLHRRSGGSRTFAATVYQ